MTARTPDALVIGGSIHHRLALREQLRAAGYWVTLESSVRRGLSRLAQHHFELCSIDLRDVPQAPTWRRRFVDTCESRGTRLRVERYIARRPRTSTRDGTARLS